jgi:hypothetical protein
VYVVVQPNEITDNLQEIKRQNAFGWGNDPDLRKQQGNGIVIAASMGIIIVISMVVVGIPLQNRVMDAVFDSIFLGIPAVCGLVWGIRQLRLVKVSLNEPVITITGTCSDIVSDKRCVFAKIDGTNMSGWYVLGLQYQGEIARGNSYILTMSPSTGWVRSIHAV